MIENVQTGERLAPEILPVGRSDLGAIGPGWRFDWSRALIASEVFRLVDPDRASASLGLIALHRFMGQHVEVDLIECHPRQVGATKVWRGVAANLLALAARTSFEIGGEGFVALTAKSELLAHFQSEYGFRRVGGSNRLIFDAPAARRLILLVVGG